MSTVLIAGDAGGAARIRQWLDAWGLAAASLGPDEHPAQVARERAQAVLYACGGGAVGESCRTRVAQAVPLILVGSESAGALDDLAWDRVSDPGVDGDHLARVLRPCLDTSLTLGCDGAGFRDFLNHELRTPLTVAGMALQTLALHLEPAGGPSCDLLDTALRNIRRLEQTVEWATDYVVDEPAADQGAPDPAPLTDLLEDLDELEGATDLSWATGAGDWQARVVIDRQRWRRLLRQVMRAVAYRRGSAQAHLDISIVGRQGGLLLVFQLPVDPGGAGQVEGEEEQLRRLLGFTVHPELARRLQLRYDVVRTTDNLRLRILLPLEQEPAATDDKAREAVRDLVPA